MRRLVGFLLGVLVIGLLVYAKSLPAMGPSVPAPDQNVPKNFWYHKDQLNQVIRDVWPTIKEPHTIGGLVEQETCISLTHRYCWSRFAKFETKRELGAGLFMMSRVVGRFDVLEEMKGYDPRLKDWSWEDKDNALFQMIGGVHKVKRTFNTMTSFYPEIEQWAATLSAYNGGIGGVRSDQRICRNVVGCDPSKWFGNVENHSLKSKVAISGYKVSFFETNRKYPVNILFNRRQKYLPYITIHQ